MTEAPDFPPLHLQRMHIEGVADSRYQVANPDSPAKTGKAYTENGITYYPGEAPDRALGDTGLVVLTVLVGAVVVMHYLDDRANRKK